MTNKTTTPSPLLVVGLDRKVRGVTMEWIKCSDKMPDAGVPVIAYVPNFCGGGKGRRIRAQYAPPKTLEQSPEADGGEYDEATDTYYCEEGWYETNEYEEVHWAVSDIVTHWQPLPEAPNVELRGLPLADGPA